VCTLCAEDAYGKTQIGTSGQYIGLSDTMQWGRRKLLGPSSHRGRDMSVTRSAHIGPVVLGLKAHFIAKIRRNSSRPLQLEMLCAQCFGTEKVFCLWTSCLNAPQSTQVSVVTQILRRAIQNKRRGMLTWVMWWFITTPAHTLQCKISSHLAGNNSIIPPTVQTWRQVIFMCSCFLNPSLLASGSTKSVRSKKPLPSALHSRQHHSTYEEVIQKLVQRYDNCLRNGGNCVEK